MAYVPATDEQFFKALQAEDPLGTVVRAHIHIEARLSQVVAALVQNPEELPKLRFEQLVKLAVALGLVKRIKPALIELGNLRNAFAHRLDVVLTSAMVAKLFSAFDAQDQAALVEAYCLTHKQMGTSQVPKYEDTDPRHKFVTMAVVLDKFLQTAETEAKQRAAV